MGEDQPLCHHTRKPAVRLGKLSGLERQKLEEEYRELISRIAYYRNVLADEALVLQIVKEELTAVRDKYADDRRTQISAEEEELEEEDLIAEEDVVIAITHGGYIKRQAITTYRNQKRGGRGITAITTKEEDFVEHLFVTTTHHYLLFFTNKGKVYRLKVYEIPDASRQSKGTAIVNLLSLTGEDKITAVIPIREYLQGANLLTATKNGIVKKSSLVEYDSSRKDGIIALTLDEEDELVGVQLTQGDDDIILATRQGLVIRFPEADVRKMGRTSRGVRGITLLPGDRVVGMEIYKEGGCLLVVTEKGFGKRTRLKEFRKQSRGGKGMLGLRITPKNGMIVGIMVVFEGDEIMLITQDGIMIRLSVDDIPVLGRVTQGVTAMRMTNEDKVVAMARFVNREED